MITKRQTIALHAAAHKAGWTDDQYRMALRNAAGVTSSTQLDQRGFERVMALAEAQADQGTYWRDKLELRGDGANERQIRLIEHLASQLPSYKLGGLCMRFSDGRTDRLDKLTDREAYNLIEMLKAVIARQGSGARGQGSATSAPSTQHSEPVFDFAAPAAPGDGRTAHAREALNELSRERSESSQPHYADPTPQEEQDFVPF